MGRTRTAWRRSTAQPASLTERLTRNQILAVLVALVLSIAAIAVAAALVSPNRARTFDLIHGSVFLADDRAPVAIDLATGKPTVRLVGASSQVDATTAGDLSVVPLADSTLLLNAKTGEFNMVDGTGFVVKTTSGGVPLPRQAGDTAALAVPSDNSAYIVRTGSTNTSVFLVNTGTVQSATRIGAKVTPRASAVLSEPSTAAPGLAVAGNGDLWILTGATNARTLRQLSLPANSRPGPRSALRPAPPLPAWPRWSRCRDPSPTPSPWPRRTSCRNFPVPRRPKHTLSVSGLTNVDRILPASNNTTGSAFLYHASKGWSLVTAAAESPVADVHALSGIPATAQLAPPALSNGTLYTMDQGATAALWQISLDGKVKPISGVASYPVPKDAPGRSLEVADFGDAQVMAQRSRVLFNSPDHVLALALFTDGSHPATTIDKSSATDLNAAGGASAITARHNDALRKTSPVKQQQTTPQPKTPSGPAINNKISCRTTTQTPHVPTITTATSASRSVLLNWTYPLLDSQDCVPSTYQIAVKTLTDGSPAAPGSATVQGQTQVNLTGLYPSTRYQLTVTAYLNGRGTSSPNVTVTTGPEGPAAPTGVNAVTDNGGNWTISWHACGSVKNGCVPAAELECHPALLRRSRVVQPAGRVAGGR